MENAEDIVEHALNYGIKSSGKRFHVSDSVVKYALALFVKDNSIRQLCDCQKSTLKTGGAYMCFMCNLSYTQQMGISMSLNERLVKSGYYK